MTQTYLVMTNPNIERRVRQAENGAETLYFYTEKHLMPDGEKWDTERPVSRKQYEKYLLERDTALSPVHKTKYRFIFADRRCEIDVTVRCGKAQCCSSTAAAPLPEEITVLEDPAAGAQKSGAGRFTEAVNYSAPRKRAVVRTALLICVYAVPRRAA